MSYAKIIIVFIDSLMMGIVNSIILAPFFFPELVGTLGAWIWAGLFTLIWFILLFVALQFEANTFILVANCTLILLVFSWALLPYFAPHLLGTPLGGVIVLAATLIWTTVVYFLLRFTGDGGEG